MHAQQPSIIVPHIAAVKASSTQYETQETLKTDCGSSSEMSVHLEQQLSL
jgi:hypothetical protein